MSEDFMPAVYLEETKPLKRDHNILSLQDAGSPMFLKTKGRTYAGIQYPASVRTLAAGGHGGA